MDTYTEIENWTQPKTTEIMNINECIFDWMEPKYQAQDGSKMKSQFHDCKNSLWYMFDSFQKYLRTGVEIFLNEKDSKIKVEMSPFISSTS